MHNQDTVDNRLYEAQVNFCEFEIGQENDPDEQYDERDEVFQELPDDLRNAMKEYFFAGHEVDVEDIFEYRRKLLEEKPWVQEKATEGLKRFMKAMGDEYKNWSPITSKDLFKEDLRAKGLL